MKTAEHLPSLASQKPKGKCTKNKFSLTLPRIPENYSDIKKIIATLSAYSKMASDKVQFNYKMLNSTRIRAF